VTGNSFHRGHIIGIGCLLWSLCAVTFALSTNLVTALPSWAFAGAALALIVPNAQSVIADYHTPQTRGRAFGVMHLSSSAGGMIGALSATNIASLRVFGHFDGWRVAFVGAATAAAAVGFFNFAVSEDPRFIYNRTHISAPPKTFRKAWKSLITEMSALFHLSSFTLIVAQGIFGNIPWSALVYLTLYFQLLGFPAFTSSALVAIFMAGVALGGLLGGCLGDAAAVYWPIHGRILVAQISVASGIPFACILTQGLPKNDASVSSAVLYAGVLFAFGLVKAWPAPACNNPLFAEIVPENQRTLVYAFDRCFETALAACTAPLVGLVGEKVFGFDGAATPSGDKELDLANAEALGRALLIFMIVPWSIDLVLYTGLHWTYGPDARKAAEAMAVAVAVEVEVEGAPEGGDRREDDEVDELLSAIHHRHS
jgi:MFS family permease